MALARLGLAPLAIVRPDDAPHVARCHHDKHYNHVWQNQKP